MVSLNLLRDNVDVELGYLTASIWELSSDEVRNDPNSNEVEAMPREVLDFCCAQIYQMLGADEFPMVLNWELPEDFPGKITDEIQQALNFTEKFVHDAHSITDEDCSELHKWFSSAQLTHLTIALATFEGILRSHVALESFQSSTPDVPKSDTPEILNSPDSSTIQNKVDATTQKNPSSSTTKAADRGEDKNNTGDNTKPKSENKRNAKSSNSGESPRIEPPKGGGSFLDHQADLYAIFNSFYGELWSKGALDEPAKEVGRIRNARLKDCGI